MKLEDHQEIFESNLANFHDSLGDLREYSLTRSDMVNALNLRYRKLTGNGKLQNVQWIKDYISLHMT